jgi:hypothetical protein
MGPTHAEYMPSTVQCTAGVVTKDAELSAHLAELESSRQSLS